MARKNNLRETAEHKVTVPTVMKRFQKFIEAYEKKIEVEEGVLIGLNSIGTCDDILYELELRRDVLRECYDQVFAEC